MQRKPSNTPLLLLVGLLFMGFAFSLQAQTAPPPPTQAAPPPPTVGVVKVEQKTVPIYGDWVASLDGYINANIQPQVSGYLIKQTYREGSYVHTGDVLF